MDRDVCLEDLCRVIGGPFPGLNSVCDNHHLLEIAKKLTQWRTLAPWLDFETAEVEALERNRSDEEGTRQQMLLTWKQRKGSDATYRALAQVLLGASRRELAERVLMCSKRVQCGINNILVSNPTSQRSSVYTTPLESPRPGSRYNTASNSGVSTPFRDAHPGPSDLLHHMLAPSPQPFQGGQDVALVTASLNTSNSQLSEHQIQAGVPMQTTNNQSLEGGVLCMSTATSYCPPGMYRRLSSVREKATMCGIPPQTQTEIISLQQEVQRLEKDLQLAKKRHERELQIMVMKQQGERAEYEEKLQLLEQQLKQSQLNAQMWETTVAQLKAKHKQKSECNAHCKGDDFIDAPFDFSVTFTRATSTSSTTSSSVISRADSGEHHIYTAQNFVYECREEVRRTLVCLQRCSSCEDSRTVESPLECQNCAIVGKFTKVHGLMEEKHSKMERSYKERVNSELAGHRLKFLAFNSQLTDVVSRSLECLFPGKDSEAAEEVREDLHWLQEKLEHCRLDRSASHP